jgi:molybdopterin synthase sulfur carrier subunit
MELEFRFFANFRDEVGQKTLYWEFDDDSVRVGDVLTAIEEDYPGIEVFDEDGSIRDFIRTMKNGREVEYIDGLDTELEDGDTISLFPPVAGG